MHVGSMCCAGGAAVCAGHAGLACMRQLCGMKVMLWRSSAAERCSALEQQTPLFSALTSANWPSHSHWRLCGQVCGRGRGPDSIMRWFCMSFQCSYFTCFSGLIWELSPTYCQSGSPYWKCLPFECSDCLPISSSQQFKVSFMIMCMEVPHCSIFPIHTWVMSQRLWASMKIKHTKCPVAFGLFT